MVRLAYEPGRFRQPYSLLHSELTMEETKYAPERTRLVAAAKLPFFIVELRKLERFLFKLPFF